MSEDRSNFSWYDAVDIGLEGRGWEDVARPFDRLPARAEQAVREVVWNLSRASTNMLFRFRTDAPTIAARWTLQSEQLALSHMTAVGRSGLDLYATDPTGAWRWAGAAKGFDSVRAEDVLLAGGDGELRTFMVYLPLYNPVDSLEIGLPPGATFEPVKPRTDKPIGCYGTSVVNGASASRPGMTHPAILGRSLDRPIINLGFSGNAHMEAEVAELVAEIDASVFVIDALPNMSDQRVRDNAERFIRIVHRARPSVPQVLVEDRTWADAWIVPERRKGIDDKRRAFRQVYRKLVDEGLTGLHYLEGETLLGDDDEGCVDGSHPTDLGFMRMATNLEPVLRRALGGCRKEV